MPEVCDYQAIVGRAGDKDTFTLRVEMKGEASKQELAKVLLADNIKELCRLRVDQLECFSEGKMSKEEQGDLVDVRVWE